MKRAFVKHTLTEPASSTYLNTYAPNPSSSCRFLKNRLVRLVLLFSVFCWFVYTCPVFSQQPLAHQTFFKEPFINNTNEWVGVGVSDRQGSAQIVENNYCEIIAPRDSSMIIANESEIDASRDFELSFAIRIHSMQAKAMNSLVSFSWGCSFENLYQYSLSITPSRMFTVRKFTDVATDMVAPKQVSALNINALNVITIQKKGGQYAFYINRQWVANAPFSEVFGGGIIFTIGGGLNVLVDYLNMDYLVAEAETPTYSLPKLLLDAPFNGNEKVVTKEADFLLTGTTIDASKLSINGVDVGMAGGRFTYRAPLINGSNVFTFEISNKAGQKQMKYVEVERVDPPEKIIVGQKRLALLIGNSKYKHSAELKNPSKDATDMGALLKGLGFEIMLYTNLDYRGFTEALKNFGREIHQYDVVLVFYAGHGIQLDGKNYMIPIDAQLNNKTDVAFEAIDIDKVVDILSETDDNNLNLLVLDACRNNPFRSWSRGGPEGLVGIHPPSGVLVAYSTSPGSYASDGLGKNGLYTEELMHQLSISQRVEDIFINTRIAVERRSNGTQSPWELARLRGKYFLK